MRTWQQEDIATRQKTAQIYKEMGKRMYESGKAGALYSGMECIIEGVSTYDLTGSSFGPKFPSLQVSR